MGKYIVTKDILNVRNQPKIADSTWVGSLNIGSVVDLDDTPVVGDTPAGTTDNTWRSDTLNRLVANAGVAPQGSFAAKTAEFLADKDNALLVAASNPQDQTKWKVSWGHIDLDIWKIWKDFGTKGAGVKVVVIDNGAWSTQNDLKGRIGEGSQSLVDTNTTLLDNSDPVHGTACAGLIGANAENCDTVYGVAPECDLIILKAGTSTIASGNLNAALEIACQLNADIISISQGTYVSNPDFATSIQKCVDQNMLVFCAAGDAQANACAYPGATPGSIAVGAYMLDQSGQRQFNIQTNYSQLITLLAPGDQVLSTSQNASPYPFNQTSAATAFAAGMFALVKSSVKNKVVNTDVLKGAIAVMANSDPVPGAPIPFNGCVAPNIYQIIKYLQS
jgi:hypothetical protein